MSDYTDYENNLAFAPTSADDLGEQGRQSEVIIKALEKCEKLEKENQYLKELLLECSEYLYEILTGTHSKLSFKIESGIRKKYYMMNLSELITKTINAIGEKK